MNDESNDIDDVFRGEIEPLSDGLQGQQVEDFRRLDSTADHLQGA